MSDLFISREVEVQRAERRRLWWAPITVGVLAQRGNVICGMASAGSGDTPKLPVQNSMTGQFTGKMSSATQRV